MRRRSFPVLVGPTMVAVLVIAAPITAQERRPAPDGAAEIVALRAELSAAQQEIVRLRALAADQPGLVTALKAARERNLRLVGIANELIAAYARRYAHGQFLPFDVGRRKFETELQAMSDRIYDNRWDASARPAPPDRAAPPAAGGTTGGDPADSTPAPVPSPADRGGMPSER